MITGSFENHESVIELSILDQANDAHSIRAVIDTGYNGCLTLPAEIINRLGLKKRGERRAMLADCTIVPASQYKAAIYWHDQIRRSSVTQTAGDVLAGTQLLLNNRLTIDVIQGGNVTIEELA